MAMEIYVASSVMPTVISSLSTSSLFTTVLGTAWAATTTTTTAAAAAAGTTTTVVLAGSTTSNIVATKLATSTTSFGKKIWDFCVKTVEKQIKKNAIKKAIKLSYPNMTDDEIEEKAESIMLGVEVMEIVHHRPMV